MRNEIALTRPLFDHLAEAASSIQSAKHVFLFLDFDGTLAPIVEEPGAAAMPRETRELLVKLVERRDFTVAIISGRGLADLQRRVGIDGLIYAGNHGLAICGRGLGFVERGAKSRTAQLQDLSNSLATRLSHISGANVENNGLTASVHFRRSAPSDLPEIRRVVHDTVTSAGDLFHVTNGLMVFEIRPKVNWNKGTAARWILTASEKPKALPMYIGDDVTDEDAFSALPAGITVKVGQAARTHAKYYLDHQDEVAEFLCWLGELERTAE
jgi:trehalose 6-phosphate phosphatase